MLGKSVKSDIELSQFVGLFKAQDDYSNRAVPEVQSKNCAETSLSSRKEDIETESYIESLREEVGPNDCSEKVVGHESVLIAIVKAFQIKSFAANSGVNCILLAGVPGTGKSTILSASAALVARSLQKKVSVWLLSISSLLSKFHGASESTIRVLYSVASKRNPSIILLDEVDSIMRNRSESEDEHSRRLKGELLARLQGTRKYANVLTLCATNKPEELDPGFQRRFQMKFVIDLPNGKQRICLLRKAFQNFGIIYEDLNFSEKTVVQQTDGFTGDAINTAVISAMTHVARLKHNGQEVDDSEILKIFENPGTYGQSQVCFKKLTWETFLVHGIQMTGRSNAYKMMQKIDAWKTESRAFASGDDDQSQNENLDSTNKCDCIDGCCCISWCNLM